MIPIYLTDALNDCQEVLQNPEENQNNWSALCQKLGNIFQGMGWFEEATTWHSRRIEANPDKINIYNDLGKIYLQLGLWQQAMDVYKLILKLNPNYAEAYLYLAHIHENLKLKHEANEYWYQTMQLQPELLNGFNPHNLGRSFWEHGELEKALNCYRVALQKNPKDLDCYRDLAEIFSQQKQFDQTIDCYQNIIKISPHELEIFLKLGHIYLQQKKIKLAVEAFQQAIKIDPYNLEYYLTVLNALMEYKKWVDVIVFSQQALEIFPHNDFLYEYLANALAKKGQNKDVAKVFQRVCDLREWAECADNGYEFTEDHFTANIDILKQHLAGFAKERKLQGLDLFCGQGMMACWLLDNVLTHPTARLDCLDTKLSQDCNQNIRKTKAISKIQRIQGKIEENIANLPKSYYHLISLNYRDKKAIEARKIILLVWELLKIGGVMIILLTNELDNNTPEHPKKGINRFFRTIKGKYNILSENNHLMLIKKINE